MSINLKKAAKKETFLAAFLSYMDEQESPRAYDFWAGLFLLSCALGRDVYVPRPRAPVFLNMYLVLVAESGVTRKSSVVRVVQKILRELQCIPVVSDMTTPEKFLLDLHNRTDEGLSASCAVVVSEMVRFFGREKYNITLPGLLTDLYDAPERHEAGGTVRRGRVVLEDVYINILTASTPTWLARAINPDIIEGGFTSRTIFVVDENRKRRIAWPEEGDEHAFGRLLEFLQRIRHDVERGRNLSISTGGRNRFSKWYNSRKFSYDAFTSSFESREDAHVLKVAGLLAINDGSWNIRAGHIDTAIHIVNEAKYNGGSLFEGSAYNDAFLLGVDKIRTVLMSAGLDGVQQNDLRRSCQNYIKGEDFERVLKTMHELGLVKRYERKTSKPGRNATVWAGTENLTKAGSMAEVLRYSER